MSNIISAALEEQEEREAAAREAARPENWPMIDAPRLFALRGCDCVADVALPDATLPINGQWRMDVREWNRYRAECAADAARKRLLARNLEMEASEV